MRIAMLCLHTPPLEQPGAGDAGGMNVYVKNLAFALGNLGHEVHLLTRSADPTRVEEVATNVWMHHLQVAAGQQLTKDELPGVLDEAAAAALEHLASIDFDVIHAHYWLSGMLGLQLCAAWNIPLVVSMHTSAAAKEHESGLPEPQVRKHSEKILLARAQRIIANTPVEARQLQRFYAVPQEKLDVVLPGVDHSIFQPLQDRPRRTQGSQGLRIVYAGRLQRLKGAHLLLQAMGAARNAAPELEISADLYGAPSGAGDYDLAAIATDAGVRDRVSFRGPLRPAELAAAFAQADLVAVPSLSETFGLVAAEAQACGTPVIANRVGGLNYAVDDGRSGWLIPEPDPQLWAAQLITLARNRELLTTAGHCALAHGATFTWERAAIEAVASYRAASQKIPAPAHPLQ